MRFIKKSSLYYALSILMGFSLAVLYFKIGQAVFYGRALEGEIGLGIAWVVMLALVIMRRYKALAWFNAALFLLIFVFILLPVEYEEGYWITVLILVAAWAVTHILVLAVTFLGRRSQLDPNVVVPK